MDCPKFWSGDVGFYMAGLAVNLAYGNSMIHHETALSISEAISSVEELDLVRIPFATPEGRLKAHANGILNVCSTDGG